MRHLSLASLIAALSLMSMGCADDGASLFITQISILDDECLVDPSTSQLAPLVDISLSENLIVYPLFASQLRDRVSPNAANPADMHVRRVDVRLEDLGGNTLNLGLPNPFRVPTNAFIESLTADRRVYRLPLALRRGRRGTDRRVPAGPEPADHHG